MAGTVAGFPIVETTMSPRRFVLIGATALTCVACGTGQVTPDVTPVAAPLPWITPLAGAVIASSAAFYGTVVTLAARTTDAIAASPKTTIVVLDSVIALDSAVDLGQGDSVTVVVQDTAGLSVGKTYGFLTYGLVLDSSAVMQETWRADASTPAARATFLDAYRAAVTIAEDQVTFDHLPDVDLVVTAVVSRVDTLVVTDSVARRRNRSENAPRWQRATLHVRQVLRGDTALAGDTVPALFPASRQIIYSLAPRPQASDSGVYLAHASRRFATMSMAGIDTAGVFVLFHSLDVRPLSDTTRVSRLLQAAPSRVRSPD